MSDAWQIAEGFGKSHQLIDAINTVSIHLKILLTGQNDAERANEAMEGKLLLKNFLSRLESVLPDVESGMTVTGSDSRSNLFALTFAQARREKLNSSPLFNMSVDQFKSLLDSDCTDDRHRLLKGLNTLRTLIEQHHHSDVVGILGDL